MIRITMRFAHIHAGQISQQLDIMQAFNQDKAIICQTHGTDVSLMAQALADSDVAMADVEVMNSGKQSSRWLSHLTKKLCSKHPEWLFLQNAIGPTACIALKRDQLQPFNPDLKWLIDIEWYYRLLKDKRVSICNTMQDRLVSNWISCRHSIKIKPSSVRLMAPM